MIEEFSVGLIDKLNDGPWLVAKWPYNGGPIAAIVSMKLLSEVTMIIGWHEHTNDWNPFLDFILKDGSAITTTNTTIIIPGWTKDKVYGLENDPTKIIVEVENPDRDEDPIPKVIQIADIETVEFCK